MSGFINLDLPISDAQIIQSRELLKQVSCGQLSITRYFTENPQKHLSSSMFKVNQSWNFKIERSIQLLIEATWERQCRQLTELCTGVGEQEHQQHHSIIPEAASNPAVTEAGKKDIQHSSLSEWLPFTHCPGRDGIVCVQKWCPLLEEGGQRFQISDVDIFKETSALLRKTNIINVLFSFLQLYPS